jgi:hypothetical protein
MDGVSQDPVSVNWDLLTRAPLGLLPVLFFLVFLVWMDSYKLVGRISKINHMFVDLHRNVNQKLCVFAFPIAPATAV